MGYFLILAVSLSGLGQAIAGNDSKPRGHSSVWRIDEGYVDAHGVFIYYKSFGCGPPLLVLHGGPGASHDYLLPHLVPLARRNRLVFIDERGGGKSPKLENPAQYTVETMVEDIEAVYQNRPDANYDPNSDGNFAWDVYREMWGSHGEFVIDGNMTSVEYADRVTSIKVPTLITVGDHDECDPSLARDMNALIPGSKLVVFPKSGHMTFVDQPDLFIEAVQSFLSAGR